MKELIDWFYGEFETLRLYSCDICNESLVDDFLTGKDARSLYKVDNELICENCINFKN